jgi:hypothetical protein
VALGGKIVNFVRLRPLHDTDQVRDIGQIAVMKNKPLIFIMGISIKDSRCAQY